MSYRAESPVQTTKSDGVFDVVVDPLKGSVDQGDRRVAVGFLCSEYSGISLAPMASIVVVS